MIGQILARLEKDVEKAIDFGDSVYVDALFERNSGAVTLSVVSTERDPSVGLYGGLILDMVWTSDESTFPTSGVRLVKTDWNIPIGRKRWGAPEGWEDLAEALKNEEVKKAVKRAIVAIEMA